MVHKPLIRPKIWILWDKYSQSLVPLFFAPWLTYFPSSCASVHGLQLGYVDWSGMQKSPYSHYELRIYYKWVLKGILFQWNNQDDLSTFWVLLANLPSHMANPISAGKKLLYLKKHHSPVDCSQQPWNPAFRAVRFLQQKETETAGHLPRVPGSWASATCNLQFFTAHLLGNIPKTHVKKKMCKFIVHWKMSHLLSSQNDGKLTHWLPENPLCCFQKI